MLPRCRRAALVNEQVQVLPQIVALGAGQVEGFVSLELICDAGPLVLTHASYTAQAEDRGGNLELERRIDSSVAPTSA
jgi:hypothetical protein